MYTLSTNNTNPTYQFRLQYGLTFSDGLVLETYETKRIRSATRLSTEELKAIGHVWLEDFLTATDIKNPGAKFHLLDFNLDMNAAARG